MSLTRKASLNSLSAALDYAARLIVGFLLNPWLVSGLGDYGYGVWQVLGRLVGHLTPASGRSTEALKWTIANRQGSTDYEEKRRYIGSTVAVWLLFLPFVAGLGALLAWFAPASLRAPADFSPTIALAVAILVVNLILVSLTDIPRAVLQGENLGYKRMGLSACLVCVGGGFSAIALYWRTGLVGVALAASVEAVLTGLLFVQIARINVPWFGIAKPLPKAVKQFLGLSGWFLVWNLTMTLMRSSDVVVLGVLDSAELVTHYSLTKYVPETIINFVAILLFSITPGLGGIIGTGDLRKAIQVRSELMSLTWLIVTIVGAATLLWNPSFLNLWVGSQYDAGALSTLLIMVTVLQFVLIRNDANIIDLTLNLRHKVLLGFFATTLSLVVAGVLVSVFKQGIIGLSIGLIAGRSILSVGYPLLIGRLLGVSLVSQLIGALRPTFTLVLLFGSVTYLRDFLVVKTWIGLILAGVATILMISPLAFYTGLSNTQRQQIIRRVRRLTS